MEKLTLSDVERLVLANQYEILAALKEEPYYDRLATQLRDGHEWLYSQALESFSPNMPSDQAEYVLTILGIFSDLKDSFQQLVDKSGIEPRSVEFPGFDGNNEAELLTFTRALRAEGRFTDTIPEHGKNSHFPTTDLYLRIIAEWRRLGEPSFPYSRETVLALTNARVHPENRK